MRKILLSVSILLGCMASQAQDTLHVIGTVAGDTKGYDKVFVYGQGVVTDSTVIKNGQFTFKIPYQPGIVPLFYTEYSVKTHKMYRPFPAVVDRAGVLYLDGVDIDKEINAAKWRGIESAERYQAFNDLLTDSINKVNQKLLAKYGSQTDSSYRAERSKSVGLIQRSFLDQLLQDAPDSYASVFALNGIGRGILDASELKEQYEKLSVSNQQSGIGTALAQHLAGLERSKIGNTVADFVLADKDGKPVHFNALRGKYVIIDFWASWCGPCIQSFPHMKEIYAKYQDENFEIYGISIDKNKEDWLKALDNLALPWLLTLDTEDISKEFFAVTAIPTTFLIDPQGKIILREIGFDSTGNGLIEKKLQTIFKANK